MHLPNHGGTWNCECVDAFVNHTQVDTMAHADSGLISVPDRVVLVTFEAHVFPF